jgi:putative transposase
VLALGVAKQADIGEQLAMFEPWKRAKRRGKARGGRPPKGPRSSERHEVRPKLNPRHPVHVTLRCARGVGWLRKRDTYAAIRAATLAIAERHLACRIVHASIQGTHLHLIVEAGDRKRLARGKQAFQISAAKRINRAISERRGEPRKGQVFPDRYHATILTSPRQVRHALAYVLNNWRRHGEDRARAETIDPYSSGRYFDGWKENASDPPLFEPLCVSLAQGWLLAQGWRRHGLISVREIPKGK